MPSSWFPSFGFTTRELCEAMYPDVLKSKLEKAQAQGWQLDQSTDYCSRCGHDECKPDFHQKGCAICVNEPLPWRRIVRLGAYRAPMEQWIVAMKYHRAWRWAPWMGAQLARAVIELHSPASTPSRLNEPPVVCAVPMHWFRRFQRGYNQAELIAQSFARELGWPLHSLLHRVKWTRAQTLIDMERRKENVEGSIAVVPVDLHGRVVWLVDDVKTSGATLKCAVDALKRQGAEQVNLAVVAVAQHESHGQTSPYRRAMGAVSR